MSKRPAPAINSEEVVAAEDVEDDYMDAESNDYFSESDNIGNGNGGGGRGASSSDGAAAAAALSNPEHDRIYGPPPRRLRGKRGGVSVRAQLACHAWRARFNEAQSLGNADMIKIPPPGFPPLDYDAVLRVRAYMKTQGPKMTEKMGTEALKNILREIPPQQTTYNAEGSNTNSASVGLAVGNNHGNINSVPSSSSSANYVARRQHQEQQQGGYNYQHYQQQHQPTTIPAYQQAGAYATTSYKGKGCKPTFHNNHGSNNFHSYHHPQLPTHNTPLNYVHNTPVNYGGGRYVENQQQQQYYHLFGYHNAPVAPLDPALQRSWSDPQQPHEQHGFSSAVGRGDTSPDPNIPAWWAYRG